MRNDGNAADGSVNIAEKAARLTVEFAFYSFIGWAYETVLTSLAWGKFADRGWLHLPLCPIYGFFAFAVLLIMGKMKSVPLIFTAGTAVTTAAELAASYILELFVDEPLWEYDQWDYNFQGRIALGSSLVFGVMCVLLIKILHPFFDKLTGKMSGRTALITASVILAAIFTDALIIIIS